MSERVNECSPSRVCYAVRVCVAVRTASAPWREIWKDYSLPMPPFIGMQFNLGTGCFDDVLTVKHVQFAESENVVVVFLENYDLSGQQGIKLDSDGWTVGDPFTAA